MSMSVTLVRIGIVISLYTLIFLEYVSCSCHVYRERPPWPMSFIFVPRHSTVQIDCSINASVSPLLQITIVNMSSSLQFSMDGGQIETLHNHGLFQETSDQSMPMSTKALLINNTEINNQTIIRCAYRSTQHTITLFTYDHHEDELDIEYIVVDMLVQAINISWVQIPLAYSVIQAVFTLSISSNGNEIVLNLTEPHCYHSIPESTPPCQVFNFSVTATPVSATYTGDGCSLVSSVDSWMLPSLPDITSLESSLYHALQDNFGAGFQLKVLIMPARFCEAYPVSGYVLEVEGPTTSSKSIVSGNVISVDNLMENEVYSFHIIVSNVVGNVSTNRTIIYTTDVQKVIATVSAEAITVQCMFVNGSTARGCMVVLVGQSDNVTVNLTREDLCAIHTINNTYPPQSITGYDIESDGTVGMLAIIGELSNDTLTCPSDDQMPSSDSPVTVIIPVVVVIVVLLIVAIVVVVVLFSVRQERLKKSRVSDSKENSVHPPLKATNTTAPLEVTGAEEDEDQLYDKPIKKQEAIERTAGDGADRNGNQYNSAMHTPESPEKDVNKGPMYAELTEDKDHTYHTLEPPRPPRGIVVPLPGEILPDEDAPALPPPYRPESPTPPPPPVYHDINELPSKGGVNKKNFDIPVS